MDDAVFCTAIELADALLDGTEDLEPLVSRRRGEQAWTRAHPGLPVVGTLDDLPDLRFLPAHGRRLNEAMLWGLKMEFPGEVAPSEGEALRGSPASPGSYTGRVRVVRGEADFGAVLPGEVLVCPTASPSWTILFAIAGALVTDGGGQLAHAAIVAREHGLPAVVGTVHATTQLVDGQIVTVDGTAGTVMAHAAESPSLRPPLESQSRCRGADSQSSTSAGSAPQATASVVGIPITACPGGETGCPFPFPFTLRVSIAYVRTAWAMASDIWWKPTPFTLSIVSHAWW